MKRINLINRYMAVLFANILLIIACEQIAKADNFVFMPPNPTETNSLREFFDDDVDVRSGQIEPVVRFAGDTITWNYVYTKGGPGYMSVNNDLADIEELRLFGNTLGGGTTSNVVLQFTDLSGHLIGAAYTFNNITWGANNVLVSNADNVLGNLQPLGCIGGFKLVVTITAGQVNFTGADFLWEVDDIEKCSAPMPEPSTLILFGTGLAAVASKMRKKLKHRKSGRAN